VVAVGRLVVVVDGSPFAGDPLFGEVQAGESAVEFGGNAVAGPGGFDVLGEGAEWVFSPLQAIRAIH
jgi:hypothetical protein